MRRFLLGLGLLAMLALPLVAHSSQADNPSRGAAGDLIADLELGRRAFTEISPNKVVPNKLGRPGGTIVDRSVSPGRAYIWDAYNNRILGINLATCYAQPGNCSADLVIGQPSATDWGACNRDATMSNYPLRAPATAETLCSEPDNTFTVLEDGANTSMWVDANGNLYVPDVFNNRIVKYVSPFTTDTVADEVWGQPDFSGVYCNRNSSTGTPPPTDTTLCFSSIYSGGAGVTLDANGNLWVADGGNNRVVRFPAGSKTADLVLGQPGFTTGPLSWGDGLNQMSSPTGVAFDANGRLYVSDSALFGVGNCRVLIFDPPFTSGMSASGTLNSTCAGSNSGHPIESVMNDPWNRGIWTLTNRGWQGYPTLWGYDGSLIQELPHGPGCDQNGGGSLGFDTNRSVLASYYTNCSDEGLFTLQGDGRYAFTRGLFSTPNGFNMPAPDRFFTPSWVGVAAVGDQLFVADTRLLFWNNPPNVTNGQAPDGFLGSGQVSQDHFGQLKGDADGRLWATRPGGINIYQTPVVTGQAPLATFGAVLPVLGGGSITVNQFTGIAPTAHGEYLWISDASTSRVIRVRNPLSSPLVDVVLGQTSITGTQCNRGLAPEAGTGQLPQPDRTMICRPGTLTLDRLGNLFVSDHSLEASGNFRLLMFSGSLFPASPAAVVFASEATKEFPRSGYGAPLTAPHGYFETAFNSQNKMVAGTNPYLGEPFLDYYNDPTRVNPVNPSDPAYALPDGQFTDFTKWPVAVTFDAQDNLYAYDANRGQVMIYLNPFGSPAPTPTPTPVPSTSGELSGTVSSSAGGAIAGANVAVTGEGIKRTGKTDTNGQYAFTDLPSGTYSVKFSAPRHIPTTVTVEVTGSPVVRNITLERK